MRTFILGEEEPLLIHGIPVLKEGFELAIECELSKSGRQQNLPYELFNQADADTLRKLVYNTNKIACTNESVIDVMTTAITAYLSGKGTAEEAAQQIQSRMAIYMAEQFGWHASDIKIMKNTMLRQHRQDLKELIVGIKKEAMIRYKLIKSAVPDAAI